MRLQESQWRESSLAIFTSGSHKEWEFEIFLLMKDPQNFIFILSKFCKKEDSWFRSPCHRLKALQPCRLQSLLFSWPVHCVACYVSKLQPAATPLVLSLSALGGGATSSPDSVGFQCCHRLHHQELRYCRSQLQWLYACLRGSSQMYLHVLQSRWKCEEGI